MLEYAVVVVVVVVIIVVVVVVVVTGAGVFKLNIHRETYSRNVLANTVQLFCCTTPTKFLSKVTLVSILNDFHEMLTSITLRG